MSNPRVTDHLGKATEPTTTYHEARTSGYRTVVLQVAPQADHAIATLTLRDHLGRDRWSRRSGTLRLDLSREDLSDARPEDLWALLGRAILDAL